jgi:hypothetical protein
MSEGITRHWKNNDKPRKGRRGFEVQEKLAAESHPGGKLTRGSGCSRNPTHKSDSVGDYFRQESKTTERAGAKSIRVQRDDLEKITAEAEATGLTPMLVFGFTPGKYYSTRCDWAAFPLSVSRHMTEAIAALLDGRIADATASAELAVKGG